MPSSRSCGPARATPGQIPAAALTAYARLEDRERALAAGYQMHIVKPVDPRELTRAVAALSASAAAVRQPRLRSRRDGLVAGVVE